MSTAVTSIPPPEEMLTGTSASTRFVTATHGLELGHLSTPVIRVAVPEAYEPVPEMAWSWAYSAQEAVGPIADFRDQVRWSQRALAYLRRRAAESVADALEERHAHRSSMRAVARDPVFAQYMSLGADAASVAVRRLGDRRYRALWLYVLQSISQDRPAQDAEGLDAATRAWRDWGRQHGLIP
jgi:hypothetical protein